MIRSILPDIYHCTLKYCSSKQYTSGVGGIVGTTNSFRMNGLFDPDSTGVGHQPYGFDQITPFYGAYTVRSCKVNIIVTANDDAANYLAWMIRPSSSASTLASSTLEQVSEFDEMNFAVLGASTSGQPFTQVTLPVVHNPKLEGLTWPSYMGNPNYRAAVTADPPAAIQFVVGIGNSNSLAAKSGVVTVEIFYDVYFENRKSLPQS